MNQQILDDLIGAPPPSTVDVDAIIVRQRRRQRVQRLAAGGSAAAGVVLAVVLAFGMAGGPRRPDGTPPATTPPGPSPSATPVATGFRLETGTKAGRERTLQRLRLALESALAEHAPRAKWIYMPDVPGEKRTPDGRPTMWISENPVFFEGRSGISADRVKGGFYLRVRPTECQIGLSCSQAVTCDDISSGCSEGRTPGGLAVVRWTETSDTGSGPPYKSYNVQVVLRGGAYTATLESVNVFGGDSSPIRASAPPLTRTELERMAADVAERITG